MDFDLDYSIILVNSPKTKRNMSNKNKIIVTGATGFVGQHLIPQLLKHHFEVLAIARDKKKASRFDWFEQVDFCSIDLHQTHDVRVPNLEEYNVIHLAWQGLPNYKSMMHFEKNLPASYAFLKHMVTNGVKKILVTGTCFEYGLQNGALSVSSRKDPQNTYGFAKETLRRSLLYLQESHPFTLQWARLFYMYGVGQNSNSLIAQLNKAIDNKDPVFNMSGGEQLRDYLSIEEVAHQLTRLFVSERSGEFNICSGTPISVRRLVETHVQERQANIQLNFGHYPYPDYEPMAFWGDLN
jgi:nucleoside-diphosphate-sugar epimerase